MSAFPYPETAPVSQDLYDRAAAVTPGGVNSPVRAYGAVGGTPRFITKAAGPYLTDADGREYVDLVCSWGPLIHGHAHPEVVAAVRRAAEGGTSYGAPTEAEIELAEVITARTPADQVRFVSSGTEATMSAIRLARGSTGRDLVVKFAGCYHGHVDALLAEAGSGIATFGLPGTPGVPPAVTETTLVLPYNDRPAVEEAFGEYGDRIACLITEAAPGNMGVIAPDQGFNRFLSETCTKHGALFISDEVMTGFRVARGGHYELDGDGWTPDLLTFGKVMGGGFPAAAFGGRADLMKQLAPEGPVYQAGTLSGNPVAMAAGLATLRLADKAAYSRLDRTSADLQSLVRQALTVASVPHVISAAGNLFSVFFVKDGEGVERPIRDFAAAKEQSTRRFRAFFHAMLRHGVHLPPSGFEAWFVSTALDRGAMDRIAAALPAAAQAAAAEPVDMQYDEEGNS